MMILAGILLAATFNEGVCQRVYDVCGAQVWGLELEEQILLEQIRVDECVQAALQMCAGRPGPCTLLDPCNTKLNELTEKRKKLRPRDPQIDLGSCKILLSQCPPKNP
jgi:hypothetical protein